MVEPDDLEVEDLNTAQETCMLVSNAAQEDAAGIEPDDPEKAFKDCADIMQSVQDDDVPTEEVPTLVDEKLGRTASEILVNVLNENGGL